MDRPIYYINPLEIPGRTGETSFTNRHQMERPQSYNNYPQDQTIDRNAIKDPPKKKREAAWVVLTRIGAAVFIILDSVSDWLQYYDMKETPTNVTDVSKLTENDGTCTEMNEVTQKYMYFTIAGTVLSVIQLANIVFQVYCEIRLKREMKVEIDRKMEYPKKLLDGRTETFYSLLLIEIPQAILLLRYQNVCLPGCDSDFLNDHLKKRITAVVNGGLALISNAWRYITSEAFCEESTESKEKGCCNGDGNCFRTCFKCCCPCCCCCHRYECTIPCCLCGKKCVCDACSCTSEAWSHAFNCGLCTFYCWPLIVENDPTQGQKCCDAKCELCCSEPMSYEPLIFHRVLAGVFNIIYVLVYFMNICNMFCLFMDSFVYEVISYVMSAAIRIFGF